MSHNPSKEKDVSFDFSIWKRASIENRHTLEQKRQRTMDKVWKAIERLNHTYKWEELYLFGSITKLKQFSESSDIDIGIQGLDKLLHFRLIADLSSLLEREVDIVRLEDCTFAETIRTRGIRWKKAE